ncbi:hypothetical protein [Pantoea sp. BAV 3049]|uniref:hypothetical protein n=1 Tax=Pantoea sp. BAV 3049 TaxID=2654188 RepID=UPI00131C1D4D|nr:hypothetical protein [Pantoea sp. BAV 3049]
MTTERITLTADPVQITDGTQTAYVLADDGVFRFADSDSKPTDLTLSGAKAEATFSEPFVIWIWAGSGFGTTVTVLKR